MTSPEGGGLGHGRGSWAGGGESCRGNGIEASEGMGERMVVDP